MNKISKWKINKIAMIMDYVGAVLYFMSLALITSTAISDAMDNSGGSSTNGLAIFLYGFAIVNIIVHVIGLINAKKFDIKRDQYIWGICGNALFLLSGIFFIPATVLVAIAGYKISKSRNIEDSFYEQGVDYSKIKDKVQSVTNNISQRVPTPNKVSQENICTNCGKHTMKNIKFCPDCGNELKEKVCRSCGKILNTDETFCGLCGTKYTEGEEEK